MKKTTPILFAIVVFLFLSVWGNVFQANKKSSSPLVYFFDVGQGDSGLVSIENEQVLLDGGPNDSVLKGLGEAMPPSDKKIEHVILTHPHADHLNGLLSVLSHYEVSEVYASGVSSESSTYEAFLSKLKEKNIPLVVPRTDLKIRLSATDQFSFIWPGEAFLGKKSDNLNNSSLVGRYCHIASCILWTGDLENEGQTEMFGAIQDKAIFQSEILKVPHHGSAGAASDLLFETVKPKYCIASAGKNNGYGHPHLATINLMKKYECTILRTDEMSTIRFSVGENGFVKEK